MLSISIKHKNAYICTFILKNMRHIFRLLILLAIAACGVIYYIGDGYAHLPGALRGKAEEQYLLGQSYYHGNLVPQSYEKAVRWYTKAATQQHIPAKCSLAECYYNGEGVKTSYDTAFCLFKEVSSCDTMVDAHYYLGKCYEEGHGTRQSDLLAFREYAKAAMKGHKPSETAMWQMEKHANLAVSELKYCKEKKDSELITEDEYLKLRTFYEKFAD